MIIDADGHLFEPPDMWREYSPAADRDLALRIEADALGYPWITFGGQSTGSFAQVTKPGGDFAVLGTIRKAQRAGDPYPGMTYSDIPDDYWAPKARAARLPEWGIDSCVLYPQSGFVWEYILENDLAATRVNMAAWNRWAVEVAREGQGALHPVGHLSLQGDHGWIIEQLRLLSEGGIRMAMFVPLLINGKRMSHPDNDPIWQAMVDYRITPAWHVNFHMSAVLDNYAGWCENDTDSFMKVVPGIFQPISAQLGLVDLAVNGVFERFPELNVVLAEVGASWLPSLLKRLDGLYSIAATIHGRELNPSLRMSPSDYIRQHALITCSFPSDTDPAVLAIAPEMFAFGGDYPHPEGLASPLRDYRSLVEFMDAGAEDGFYGANITRVLTTT
jgi:predicted TIM-barrel fold metal-dependent hydrolase